MTNLNGNRITNNKLFKKTVCPMFTEKNVSKNSKVKMRSWQKTASLLVSLTPSFVISLNYDIQQNENIIGGESDEKNQALGAIKNTKCTLVY